MIQANEQHEEPSPLREAECPKCKALFLFQRARVPHFDEQGFETYKLEQIPLDFRHSLRA